MYVSLYICMRCGEWVRGCMLYVSVVVYVYVMWWWRTEVEGARIAG